MLGSPPQVRGKPVSAVSGSTITRITPAGAGKTAHTLSMLPSLRDHPRRCGENHPLPPRHRRLRGSPPQVRGKRLKKRGEADERRITPAGAGKTSFALRVSFFCWDHPRRCGENRLAVTNRNSRIGSPPQVRGKPFPFLRVRASSRITPAGAGKTTKVPVLTILFRDHPRRCGENLCGLYLLLLILGSPPQVRGKHTVYFMSADKPRITPAGAGKTIDPRTLTFNTRDHPRRCGENEETGEISDIVAGSPPQVRGKRMGQ